MRSAPEDCGGIPGYYKPVDFVGEDFDSAAFSVDEVNRRLARLQGRKKAAAKK
jgi:hypothetical protein